MRTIGALSVVVAAIPILLIAWKVLRVPFKRWLPLLAALGVFALIQGCTRLVDPEAVTAILYLLAGAGRGP